MNQTLTTLGLLKKSPTPKSGLLHALKMMLIVSVYILMKLACDVQGQEVQIKAKFISGNVMFTWTPHNGTYYNVEIIRNKSHYKWEKVNHTTYTFSNVLLYNSIGINVRLPESAVDNNFLYTVNTVKGSLGESSTIFWNINYFPQTGIYRVYHMDRNGGEIIVINWEIQYNTSSKYDYISKPYNSTIIKFRINNLTVDDAGYYTGGESKTSLCSGCGVVLIVYGRPTKPEIKGTLDKLVSTSSDLTCSSNSTSAPDYYSKLVTLSYTWFKNDTKMDGKTNQSLRFKVTRGDRYNRYSCTATEKDVESIRSDSVKINPLYGPNTIEIDRFQTDLVTRKEGEKIGPYRCSVDCNPPCEIIWERENSSGHVDVLANNSDMPQQQLKKDMTSLTCIAKWESQHPKRKTIRLDVQYIEEPIFYLNNSPKPESTWTVGENVSMLVSCLVHGNPTPKVRLIRGLNELSSSDTRDPHWANYTIISAHCEYTDNYTCMGSAGGFENTYNTVSINVSCNIHIDENGPLQTNYSSMSGENVKVALAIPVIANPPPQASDITWAGPSDHQIKSSVSQRDVVYKHWINTSIPIYTHSNFGCYVIKYKNKIIHNITINAQDRPQTPLDFMAYSYASGKVNLTWTSGFNGGAEQFFILMIDDGIDWKPIANLTDPGKGKTVYLDPGSLTPGQEIWYRLQSCNELNCSIQYAEIKVNIKEISKTSKIGTEKIIGASIGIFILIVGLTVVFAIFFRRKNKKEKDNTSTENEITQEEAGMFAVVDKKETSKNRNVGNVETSGATKDAGEMYAAVDKSLLKGNKIDAVLMKDDIPNEEEEHGAEMYSVVDKSLFKKGKEPRQTTKLATAKKTKRKKEGKNGSLEEKNEASVGSRKTNDEGLIYIDVDFTNKPESTDTKQKPVIHGEEDRTEYTFVDFSKKAPPTQEARDFEGKQDEG